MHTPDFNKIFTELEAERKARSLPALSSQQKIDVAAHINNTLAAIKSDDTLRQLHEGLSEPAAHASMKQYAHDLADNKVKEHSHLRDLLTVSPAQPAAPAKAPLAHLLRDEENMRIFREQVRQAAETPSAAGHRAAQWIHNMLHNDHIGEKGVIEMFEKKLKVLENADSTARPSRIASSVGGIKGLLKDLSKEEKKELYKLTLVEEKSLKARFGGKDTKPDMYNRRVALGVIATAALGFGSYAARRRGINLANEAVGADMDLTKPLPGGRADKYFGEDPDIVAARPENIAKAEEAHKYAVGANIGFAATGAAGGVTLWQAVKRIGAVNPQELRKEVSGILASMDHIVDEMKAEVKRQQSTGIA